MSLDVKWIQKMFIYICIGSNRDKSSSNVQLRKISIQKGITIIVINLKKGSKKSFEMYKYIKTQTFFELSL